MCAAMHAHVMEGCFAVWVLHWFAPLERSERNIRTATVLNQHSRVPRAGREATAPRIRPIDRLMGLYAGVSGAALFFPHRTAIWPLLAMLHLAALFLAVAPQH